MNSTKILNLKRDKFLFEVMGECWHFKHPESQFFCGCVKCKKLNIPYNETTNTDFSSWEGFGKLWNFAKQQDWWVDFIDRYRDDGYEFDLVNPDNFADTLHDFIMELDSDS